MRHDVEVTELGGVLDGVTQLLSLPNRTLAMKLKLGRQTRRPLPLGGGGPFLLVSEANLEKRGERVPLGANAALWRGCPPHPVFLTSLPLAKETRPRPPGWRGRLPLVHRCSPHGSRAAASTGRAT